MKKFANLMIAAIAATVSFCSFGSLPTEFKMCVDLTLRSAIADTEITTGVPALVRLSEEKISGFSYADFSLPNGGDMMFTDENDVVIPHEVDTWNTNGESLVWVKLPSTAANTKIKMYYGNGATSSASASDVWSDYVGVWHLGEAGGANADITVYDSTSSNFTGTAYGCSTSGSAAGRIGSGWRISDAAKNDTNGGIVMGSMQDVVLAGSDSKVRFTVSAWMWHKDQDSYYDHLFFRKNASSEQSGWSVELRNNEMGKVAILGAHNSEGYLFIPDTRGKWAHVAMCFDDTDFYSFGNGALSAHISDRLAASDRALAIAFGTDSDHGDIPWKGVYDELRIRKGAYDANYLAAEYKAMNCGLSEIFIYGDADDVDQSVPKLSGLSLGYTDACDFHVSGSVVRNDSVVKVVFTPVGGGTPVEVSIGSVTAGNGFDRVFGKSDGLVDETYYSIDVVATANDKVKTVRLSDSMRFGVINMNTHYDKQMTISVGASFATLLNGGELTNFPVLVRLSTAINGFDYSDFQVANGGDLAFTNSDGVELAYEIDTWNTDGESLVWVLVPRLNSSTVIKCYFDGDNYQHDPSEVWAGYLAVIHGGASLVNSAASGLSVGANATTLVGSGHKIGGGINKAAMNSVGITIANPISEGLMTATDPITFSAWYREKNKDSSNTAIMFATYSSWGNGYLALNEKGTEFDVAVDGSHQSNKGRGALVLNQWQHYAFTYDVANTSLNLYCDGENLWAYNNARVPGASGLNSKAWTVGSYAETGSADSFCGDLDEIRLYKGVKSGKFLAAERLVANDSASLSYSDVISTDPTRPVVGTPELAYEDNSCVFSVRTEGPAPASVKLLIAENEYAMSTEDVGSTRTYSVTKGDLPSGHFYDWSVKVTTTSSAEIDVDGERFYLGEVSVAKLSDATVAGLVPGSFRVSIAETAPADFAVAYTVGGTAIPGADYVALSGSAVIPAGSDHVDVAVTPCYNPQMKTDRSVVLTITPSGASTAGSPASLTLAAFDHEAGFRKRIKFDISGYSGETALNDFPVLVRLSSAIPGFDYGDFSLANGGDLRFTLESGEPLSCEVDTWNTSGESLVWVKVPELTKNARIVAYYGNADPWSVSSSATWSGQYLGVWHFNEISNKVTPDSTGNELGMSGKNGLESVQVAVSGGQIGNALVNCTASGGTNGGFVSPAYAGKFASNQFTVSAWFNRLGHAMNGYERYFSSKNGYADANGFEMEDANGNKTACTARGSAGDSVSVPVPDQTVAGWNKFTLVYSGSKLTVYVNGSKVLSNAIVTSVVHQRGLAVGNDADGNERAFWGNIDEVRFAKSCESADWVKAEYDTETVADFVTTEEGVELVDVTAPKLSVPSIVRNLDGSYTVSVVATENVPVANSVKCVVGGSEYTMTTSDGSLPQTYAVTVSDLESGNSYKYKVTADSSAGNTVVKDGVETFYVGDISIAWVQDAIEHGLVPGVFRVSRADTFGDLVVNFQTNIATTAIADQTYVALVPPVVITNGASSVDIVVEPLMDAQVREDRIVAVDILPGLYGIGAGSAQLTVVNLVAPAEYNTWVAAADGKASVASNWSQGVPKSTDRILFDGNFSTANCEWDAGTGDGAPSMSVAGWVQREGYSGMVMIDTVYSGDFECFTVNGDMDIGVGSVSQHTNTTANTDTYRLRLNVTGDLSVASGAKINVSACGPNNGVANASVAYAADLGDIGSTWGDPKLPTACGKTGTNKSNAGAGGAAYITVTGTTTINGSLLAEGVRTISPYANSYNGWGCGGSIYLETGSFAGSGIVSVNAELNRAGDNSRGTPGRISVWSKNAASTFPVDNLRAWGDCQETDYNIGAGTVVVRNPGEANGTLYVRNNPGRGFSYNITVPTQNQTTSIPKGDTWTFDAVVLGNYGMLTIPTNSTLVLPNGFASVSCLNSGNAASSTRNWHCGIIVREGGTINATPVNGKHEFKGGRWTFCPCSTYTLTGNVEVSSGANIGVPLISQGTANFISCNLKVVGDMDVKSDGLVSAEYGGIGGNGSYAPQGYVTFEDAPIANGKANGTGHGGQKATFSGNNAYDSFFDPHLPGSAGGHADQRNVGAGVVNLEVTGTLNVDGRISGTVQTFSADNHAGGAGSLNVKAGSLTGSGKILANTNPSFNDYAKASYGSYGGGRIAVRLTSPDAVFSDYWKTNIFAKGYSKVGAVSSKVILTSENQRYSSAGSVYLQNGDESDKHGTIIIRNDGAVENTSYTSIPAAAETDALSDFRNTRLQLVDCGRVRLYDSFKVSRIDIAANSTVDFNGNTLTVSAASTGSTRIPAGEYDIPASGAHATYTALVNTSNSAGKLIIRPLGLMMVIR